MTSSLAEKSVSVLVAIGAWLWLAQATHRGLEIIGALAADAFLIIPIGSLIVATLPDIDRATRFALMLCTGYAATTLLAIVFGTLGWLSLYWYVCAVLFGVWVIQFVRRLPGRGWDLRSRWQSVWCSEISVLLVIVSLSLVAITPMLVPVQWISSQQAVSYAYIDTYQSLSIVQGLVRHIPAEERFSIAGLQPFLYPDFHYVYLALLKRITHAASSDVYFVDGAILLVILGIPLAYALGRELTGRRLGGYIGATMLYLGVVPNPYDLNPTLGRAALVFMPTFYQVHFFSPRYNEHEGAGGLLIMGGALCLLVAQNYRARQSSFATLLLGGCLIAALARFRSQHLLAAGPGFVLLSIALWFRSRNRGALIGAIAFIVTMLVLTVLSFGQHYNTDGARLLIHYGDFGWELLNNWFLPARFRDTVAQLPSSIAPAAAIVVWVLFRVIGSNLAALIVLRIAQLAWNRQAPTVVEWFCALSLLSGGVAVLFVRHDLFTLGFQLLPVAHLLAVLVSIIPLYKIAETILANQWVFRRRRVVGAVMIGICTLIASRAADAAMHDQPERGYILTNDEIAAYEWIQTNTAETAIIAAHPDHRVNSSGERIMTTNFLSAMTDRRVYLQRGAGRPHPRETELRDMFAAVSGEAACQIAMKMNADYIVEYEDTKLIARDAACVEPMFTRQGIRVVKLLNRDVVN